VSWPDRIASRLDSVRKRGQWREVRALADGHTTTSVWRSGTKVVSFASNDYLGLSQHPAVIAAAHDALDRDGAGAGAARLIVGGRPAHDDLETAVAGWKQRPAALLFSTGYQANLGVLGALAAAAPGCVIHSDELNHASIIDGARLARADVRVFPHGDLDALARALDDGSDRPRLVVSDEVFSMDGDEADTPALAACCADHDALLVLDVAHSVLAAPSPPDAILVGTLSKTLGSLGGFVAGPRDVIDLCRNTARSFIFTTASTPADTAAAVAAIGIADSREGAGLTDRLRVNVDRLRSGHPSPIIPVLLGSEDHAVEVAHALLEAGLLVPAIRPPTVAPGSSRLRIAVSATHETADLDRLAETLGRLGHPI